MNKNEIKLLENAGIYKEGIWLAQKASSPISVVSLGNLQSCKDKVKENVLNVPNQLIEDYTAESLEVTQELVRKAQSLFKSDLYVACTGLLKRGGSETKDKPVGTFFYCISYKDQLYDFQCVCKGAPQKKLRSLNSKICKSIINVVRT